MQIVIVAVLCSMLGGGLMFGAMQLFNGSTAVQDQSAPASLFQNTTQNSAVQGTTVSNVPGSVDQVTAIAEKVSPSVVTINTYVQVQNFFSMGSGLQPESGSGIIIRSDGYILTNNHVITDALTAGTNSLVQGDKIEVILPGQKDKPYTAKVIGRDAKTDIAILQITASNLPAAELGDSNNIKVGQLAVAIGNPMGDTLMGTVTAGIISGLDRSLTMDNGEQLKLIQTDAAINPGNSGGPLCNSQGQVIGINTAKISAANFEGLGFAIPISDAKTIADALIQSGYVKGRPFLGVSIDPSFTEQVATSYKVPAGLLVASVQPLSPASSAGIQIDDIITKFDGQSVKVFSDLQTLKDKHKPGDVVAVEIYRNSDKSTRTLSITLAEDTTGN